MPVILTKPRAYVNQYFAMVNAKGQERSTKAVVLDSLRRLAGEPVSGEQLAASAGVSRVAVWKAAEALRAAGYALASDEKGYRLDPESPDDFLYPWEFSDREGRFRHWEETESTMDRARELADRGAPSGTVAVAERQTAGRGRGGRSWASEDGGLFFTMILGGGDPIQQYARTGMAVQIAVARAVQATIGAETHLRWPNDVYVRGRKIAGILSELRGEADRLRWISVGVGINVNNEVPLDRAASCAKFVRHPLSRRQLLAAILNELEGPGRIVPQDPQLCGEWNALADLRGKNAAITDATHGEEKDKDVRGHGRFLGVDAYGRAVVQTEDGTIELEAGTASLIFETL